MKLDISKKVIWVAGHLGLAGSSIVRRLDSEDCQVIFASKKEVNLLDQTLVENFVKKNKPDVIINAAGRVGGIMANIKYPVEFLYENLMIQSNILRSAYDNNVKKLLFLGSSCIYPANSEQPMKEECFMKGELEKTNEYYALAKIVGIKLCNAYRKQYGCNFISVMPTNLYGPNDNFNEETSHVPAALICKFHKAKIQHLEEVVIWGNGEVLREFIHVDDFADACVFLLKNYSDEQIINIGTGVDIRIKDFAKKIKKVVDLKGKISFDAAKPAGVKRKLLDISRLTQLGWHPKIDLNEGLTKYYDWFLSNEDVLRR